MNVKIFNVAMMVGWLMVLAGGVVIHPGWGVAIAGALLLVLSLASAYLAGLYAPGQSTKPADSSDGEGA